MDTKLVNILLVEDSPGDIALIQEALQDSKLVNKLYIVKDGLEALNFLRKKEKYEEVPRPDLILLDLNLPKMNGKDVLAEIKQDTELQRIPVVIMTSSKNEEDILRSYNLKANCYIVKPLDFNQFVNVVQSIEQFWFSIVCLPPE